MGAIINTKARIKILVKALTPEGFAEKVEMEFAHTQAKLKSTARSIAEDGFYV